jgi:hypothetical protein
MDVVQPIAKQVAALPAIQHPDPTDYWALATAGEAKLLALDLDAAVAAYTEAVTRHSEQSGSIQSTRDQVEKLLAVLPLSESDQQRVRSSFDG